MNANSVLVWLLLADISEELSASVILLIVIGFSAALVSIYETPRYNISRDSYLHYRRPENLVSQVVF